MRLRSLPFVASLVLGSLPAAAVAHADDEPVGEARVPAAPYGSNGDLFPAPGHPTVSFATGLPFLAIGEVGLGITNGIAVGVIGGVTPSVLTAGIRPRFRLRLSERYAAMLIVPMLFYPSASAPGPGNIGSTTWVLARPEMMLDATLSERVHVAGGMGIIAAASTLALKNKLQGKEFGVPAYNGSSEKKVGFAGGIWNTVCARTSYALAPNTHLFAEGSLVLSGLTPADNVGGVPFVATLGAQHTF
jgi:hypothetical protein